jgi:hypothetical protein
MHVPQPSSTVESQSSSTPLQLSMGGAQEPHAHDAEQVRDPVEPQLVVQLPVAPWTHVWFSSMDPSQSSSDPLQASVGGEQLPHAQLPEQVREPVVPHVVVHEPVVPAQHPSPSSQAPLQSSSMPLHTSAGGEHALQPQLALHVREPVEPQLVMQDPVVPAQHANVSSHIESQSSSMPLHASIGGVHAPQPHDALHVLIPAVPQAVVQLPVVPGMQVDVSSMRPSQSSSMALQVSAGGEQEPYMQLALQLRVPVEPQLVVQAPIVPGVHSLDSSTRPSQSSSMPLQPSAGGVQAPNVQLALHVREPVEPQLVVQPVEVPRTQPKSSSTLPSQSSSDPLHVSAGAVQALKEQSSRHVRAPVEPHVVVQLSLVPRTHAKTSSAAPLQSSSTPLQISVGGAQTSQEHVAAQVRLPIVPQLVMHAPVSPRQHVKPSSQPFRQSSSMPLQISGAPGFTSGLSSLQSVAGTSPVSAQVESPNPSPSTSRVVWTQIPRIDSLQRSLVQGSPSLQSVGVPGAQVIISSQVSTPLHVTPSPHSASFWHERAGHPSSGSHVVPSAQSASSGSCRQAPSSQRSSVQATSSSHSAAVVQPASGVPVSGIPVSGPESTTPASGTEMGTQSPS